jgi:hypothetical protein
VSLETRSVEVSWSGSDVYATVRATGALQASAAVAADFDGDGVADVVAGWRGAESGVLVLLQGDADAVYQDRPEARARRKAIGSPFSPFAASKVIDSPEVGPSSNGDWAVVTAAFRRHRDCSSAAA